MHYEILDERRRAMLPLFKRFKERFYLAGGTALALQLGHRDSVDFDFFCAADIDTVALFEDARMTFAGHSVVKVQEERNTLTIIADDVLKVSFFSHPYPLIRPTVRDDHLTLASIEDIACMKFSAITGRASIKDYVDLSVILQRFPLAALLGHAQKKYPALDRNLILKSLVYFDDIIPEPIRYMPGHAVAFSAVEQQLREAVQQMVGAQS